MLVPGSGADYTTELYRSFYRFHRDYDDKPIKDPPLMECHKGFERCSG